MNCEKGVPNFDALLTVCTSQPTAQVEKKVAATRTENEYDDIETADVEEVQEDEIVENVTVKFRIYDIHVIARVYPNRLTIYDIKEDLARKFELDPKELIIKQCGRVISDDCVLLETCCNDFGIHEFILETKTAKDGDNLSRNILDLDIYYKKYNLPDFITVHIKGEDTEDGNPKDIIVEIQNRTIIKPFLCGYRNKNTGIEYLDAYSQTGPIFDKAKYRRYVSRDTQTSEVKTRLINTMHDQTTQCFLDGNNVLHVSSSKDFTIMPKKYQSYAQKMRLENKLAKIILIQRNWRRYLWVRYMKNAAKRYRQLIAAREANDRDFEEEIKKRIAREQRAKMFPRSKEDFELLYHEVENWKRAELKRIASMYEGAARIVEVNMLLDKEIQILNGIERQRYLVFKSMKDFREQKLLTKLGEPVKWIGYNDTIIHLDLLRTQRARFLSEIYKDLKKPLEKWDRLQLITKVKEILLNEQDFPQFAELFDLFEREKNLLIYMQYCDVEVLRTRINGLFLDLIKYSRDKGPSKEGRRMCLVCKEVKPLDKFEVRTRQNQVDTCSRCHYLKFASKDNTVYVSILRAIQRDERKKRCVGSFAFILQVDDVRCIVEQIWHGHSILSKNNDLNLLRLPRWIKSDDWSPWNCVCLTEYEARDHYRIDDPTKVYNEKLLLQVRNCLMLGRSIFHKLAAVATEFLETGQWWRVGLNKQRQLPPITKFNDPTSEVEKSKCKSTSEKTNK